MTDIAKKNNNYSVQWLIEPTKKFRQTVDFYKDVVGLKLIKEGVAQTDYHFDRFAQFTFENGVTLEIVEPKKEYEELFNHPIRSLKVDNLKDKHQQLIENGAVFISDILDSGTGIGWAYFKGVEGIIIQIEGNL